MSFCCLSAPPEKEHTAGRAAPLTGHLLSQCVCSSPGGSSLGMCRDQGLAAFTLLHTAPNVAEHTEGALGANLAQHS